MTQIVKVRLALFLGIILVSVFPILIKMELASGLISAFYRMAIAACILVPYALFTGQYKVTSIKYFLLSCLCGLIFASDITVWNIAIQSSTATQATLLTNLSPLWVGIFSLVFLKIRPASNFWVGVVLALIGLVILIGYTVFINLSFDMAFGLAVLSGIFYACYFLVSKYTLEKVEVIPFMAYSTLAASVYLLFLNIRFGEQFFGYNTQAWSSFLVQGLLCQLAAWLLLGFSMKHMRPTRVSLSMLSQALVTALLAVVFLDEHITLQMVMGGCLILLGIAATFKKKPIFG
ncbi:putative membrane protein [Balneicella halophila]|uniref:Putative membrane protein n=1 Tax=Balneicella halophila TaxID=1537566 RepID=A0A7L4UQF7_BALHA|nr:DMT family transporter [Balneicella halophila]PVX51909.1 putative membrane protein [Balneicella halophila]